MRIFIPVIMLLLALLLVIFGAQNTQAVNVKFLGVETGMISLALVIVISAIFGAVLTGLFGLWMRIRYGIRSWRANKQRAGLETRNRELEQRVAALESEKASLSTAQPAKVAEPEPGAKEKVAEPEPGAKEKVAEPEPGAKEKVTE